MKRFATLVVGMCLLVGVVPGVAKKKPAKPVIETFEATLTGLGVLRLEVEEFSTDQDVQELAQAYAKGGKDGVGRSLESNEKGRYRYQLWDSSPRNPGFQAFPIRFIQSASKGGIRTLYIIADAADSALVGQPVHMEPINHRGYPFTVIELHIDQQGKGIGQQVPFSAIVFNKQGTLDVNPMFGPVNGMVHFPAVHAVPR